MPTFLLRVGNGNDFNQRKVKTSRERWIRDKFVCGKLVLVSLAANAYTPSCGGVVI